MHACWSLGAGQCVCWGSRWDNAINRNHLLLSSLCDCAQAFNSDRLDLDRAVQEMLAEIRYISEAPQPSIQHPEGESDVISSDSFGKGDEEEEQYSLSSSSRRRRTRQQMASKEEDSVYNETQPEEGLQASSYRLDSNDKVSPDVLSKAA